MKEFTVHNPTKLIFGMGAIDTMAHEFTGLGKKALLVYGGGSIKKNGAYDGVTAQLTAAGIDFYEHSGVSGNPRLSHAQEGIKIAREKNVDFIVAVGGGSVIDESKAISLGAGYDGNVWDFYSQKGVPEKALTLITVLTLPATASEMNPISVLTNDETKEKNVFNSSLTYPLVSFLDPGYTTTLSLEQTGFAAADIISHATEGYFVTPAKELYPQDELIEGVVRSVVNAMDILKENPEDIDARASLMWSATLAWNGILQAGIPGMGLPCHSIEMPLSGLYDIAHGGGLSIITPHWMRVVESMHRDRILRFGRRCLGVDTDSVDDVASAMEDLYRRIGAPLSLSEAGVSDIDIPVLTELALKAFKIRKVDGYSKEMVEIIYQKSL